MGRFERSELEGIRPGPIAWMASHPVAANLLMLVCLLGGLYMYGRTVKEVFPAFALDTVSVGMSYPGASPEEVEKAVVLALENAVRDVEGLGEITATASEGSARLTAEILDPAETMRIQQDIKTAVDRITTFPDEAENLTVSVNARKRGVMELALYGDADEAVLREAADILRERLEADPAIGPVELSGIRDPEIHIDVPQEMLRRYNLSLPDIAARVRTVALEMGGGALKTENGEILVRMSERRDTAAQFRTVPVISRPDGSQVLLGDIAVISEGFEDTGESASYDGKKAVLLNVYRIGDQTPVGVARAVRAVVDGLQGAIPEQLQVGIIDDDSRLFMQRAELLLKNGLWGLILVVGLLALFLDIRLALWVGMGIPISFLGAFLLFPATDFTVNIISMFAFIIALGIVVDDAIVTGENIYHFRQNGLSPLRAAVDGARDVAVPVAVSVVTNMIAFIPLFFVPGVMGKIFGIVPVVVCSVFFMSLVESLFILPSHLTFRKADPARHGVFARFVAAQKAFNRRFEDFVQRIYGPFLERVVVRRYLAVAVFFAVLAGIGGYALSGRMGMMLFPRVESDYAFASATLPVGAPESAVDSVRAALVSAAQEAVEENGGQTLSTGIYATARDNTTEVRVFLTEPDVRPVGTAAFTEIWRKKTGGIPGLETLSFQSNRGGPGSGAALTVELSHRSTAVLDEAAQRLAQALAEFDVTRDIDDGAAQGKRQFDFTMSERGYAAGLSTQDVARQVRAAFYGSEAFRQQRGRDEVRVLARLPDDERNEARTLDNLMLRASDGSEILLREAVRMTEGRAYTVINRRDGRRTIQVTADVEPPSQASRVMEALRSDIMPELRQRYPGLGFSFEGRQADIRDSVQTLLWGLFAVLFVMYAILAVLFGGYIQPLMVLVAIPFSAVGAVLGHLLMGYSLSVMSLFGMMALAGVVVNDSLIMIDFANRRGRDGASMEKAIVDAGVQRFRPILLTTVTTFSGLAPMIFETSRQARFLIPMAISLGYGILFATMVTLVLIPALYAVAADLGRLISSRFSRT